MNIGYSMATGQTKSGLLVSQADAGIALGSSASIESTDTDGVLPNLIQTMLGAWLCFTTWIGQNATSTANQEECTSVALKINSLIDLKI